MRILVCAKQVPNTNNVRIDPVKGTLIREGVESILNPDDANAVEAALRIKDAQPDTTITVISMGPPQAKEMLIECIAMGCDDAILLSDRAFGGSDTWATSNAIAAAIRKVGNYDLILAGRQAIDGDTAQVAPQTAEKLNIPQITYVQDIKVEKDKVIVQRQLEDGYEVIEAAFPCMLTCIKELNTPRYMRADRIIECYVDESAGGRIQVWGFTDVEVPQEKVGLKSSPTNVFRSFTPAPKGKGVVWTGMPKELAGKLNDALREKHIVA